MISLILAITGIYYAKKKGIYFYGLFCIHCNFLIVNFEEINNLIYMLIKNTSTVEIEIEKWISIALYVTKNKFSNCFGRFE